MKNISFSLILFNIYSFAVFVFGLTFGMSLFVLDELILTSNIASAIIIIFSGLYIHIVDVRNRNEQNNHTK